MWQEVIKGVLGIENAEHHSRWWSLKRCCPLKRKKKKRKVATYVSFGDLSEETPWDTASHIAPRNCPKELREEPGYPGVLLEKNNKHTHKHPTPPKKEKKTHSILSYMKR